MFKTNVELESGVTLTVKGELLMPDDATIRVNPGARVAIDGGRIDNACGGMWRGIEVFGNPNLPQTPTNQGYVAIGNEGSVENAIVGISLGIKNENNTPDLSTTGGYMTSFAGAKFINCQRSVVAYNYYSQNNNSIKFYNTTFEINDELLFDLLPGSQVNLRGVQGVVFENCSFINSRSEDFSTFEAGRGISSSFSQFSVEQCTFDNLELGIVVKSHGFDDIKISQNTFTNNLGGISLRYAGLAEVVENEFNIPGIDDLNIHPSNVAYGIYLGGATGYEVEENVFIGDARDGNAGVAVQSSGPEHNVIYKNRFENLAVGIVAMGNNRGPGLNLGLEFLCDSLGTFDQPLNYSIALTSEGEVQHHQGVLTVENGGAGNLFYPQCAPFSSDREFYVGEDTPIESPVNYIPFAEEYTRPDCNTEAMVTVGLSDDPFNYNQHCPSNQSSGGVLVNHVAKYQLNQGILSGLYDVYDNTVNGGDTEFLLDLIDDPFVTSFDLRNELLLASPRVTDVVMISAIQRDPELNPWHLAQILLANSPLTQRVLNVLNHSDVNAYYRELVMDGQNGGMTNTTLMEMELSHFSGKMQGARADYVRQAYRQDSTMALNDSIVHYLSDDASDDGLQMLLSYHIERQQWQQAQDLLNDAPNRRWHSDFAEAMGILVEALQDSSGADAYIASNETALLAIANGTHREAYLARAILESYGLAEFEYPIELPQPPQKSMKLNKEESIGTLNPIASIHPNPAKNTVYLDWRLPEEIIAENVQLLVYNSQGIQLHAERLNGQVGISEINISNWPSGLYIYQLQHEQIKLHSEKFEVLR